MKLEDFMYVLKAADIVAEASVVDLILSLKKLYDEKELKITLADIAEVKKAVEVTHFNPTKE